MTKEKAKKYQSKLSLLDTEIAIKKLKDYFETQLAAELNLIRVSAPLFVNPETGLNDDLTGIESPVSFDTFDKQKVQIVQSLAKWKRMATHRYGISEKSGLYTDMNAIRKDEEIDDIHSYYVNQWDWEKVIAKSDRTMETLKETVDSIYRVLKRADEYITLEYPALHQKLPQDIFYISAQQLEDEYPELTGKEREYEICNKHKAVCITQIGKILKSGKVHEGRAPDYDDWELNADIIVFNDVLGKAFELSSMGIRVDKDSLIKQLRIAGKEKRLELDYHKAIVKEQFPYTIGGGIGQSRLCMFFLEKAHIGEVQCSVWSDKVIKECEEAGITLL
ncbi:MAG: aspartate--ammonia ligase [Bacilli bacterium]|nr:aspartate--ammonia ligase [Bacilli bacterium]MDD3304825.1 aspartate--ammonia ligase [Bacilli bacterium]MDD4053412.1 aspartate--ammonia ligase [Bacilli bacterium]MDD4410941.1 aspartate--ammonia ligase [Bacilli bacterium]